MCPKVYVTNKSAHDVSAAEHFGEIVYLSEGPIDKFSVNHMCRQFNSLLLDSSPEDYFVLTSLTVMNVVACGILARKHGVINLLLYSNGIYVSRRVDFDTLLSSCKKEKTDG